MSTPQFLQTGYLKTPNRSSFDMSHTHLTTTNFGALNVVLSEEVLPNDTWKMRQSALVRFMPILAPVMSRMDVKFYWFFTPNRLVYKDWEDFISPSVEDTISYDRTISVSNGYTKPYTDSESIMNYYDYLSNAADSHAFARWLTQLGLPFNEIYQHGTNQDVIDLLPIMAYQRVWFDYFRDENLDDATPLPTHGGHYHFDPDNPTSADSLEFIQLFTPRVKSWDKDYFTSALPFAQKGPKVTIPIGETAPVTGTLKVDSPAKDIPSIESQSPNVASYYFNNDLFRPDLDSAESRRYYAFIDSRDWVEVYPQYSSANNLIVRFVDDNGNQIAANSSVKFTKSFEPARTLYGDVNDLSVDLTAATATTIDQFRTLFQLQRFFERAALVGTRYVELLKGFFGVTSSDARMQRAEYLGGCRIPVISNEVFSNTETIDSTDQIVNPVGSYAGKANAFGGDAPIKRFFEEHGFLTCIMVCVPKTAYYQGMPRKFSDRKDYTQYFWPQFAHLGEQEVHNSELYYHGNDDDKEPFGYQSRYVEYKFIPDHISGSFRPTLSGGLNLSYWHLGRNFSDHQLLNNMFIHIDAASQDLDRIFAITDTEQDNIMCQIEFDITAIRAMPVFAEQFLSTSI